MADINVGAISEALNNKMDLDGNNVIASAGASFRNTSNWSNNMTNCITYIPQDINLELNNGTLILKAGSKVYVPNGAGVFDAVTSTTNVSTTRTDSQECIVWRTSSGGLNIFPKILFYSGTTAPTEYKYMFWYDTTANKCKVTSDYGSTWAAGASFPICLVETDGTKISAIKQVFNGFGHVGATVFALPGVRGLIPDGRNADGSLKNTEFTISSVLTIGYNTPYNNYKISLNAYGVDINVSNPVDRLEYKEKENINYNNNTNQKANAAHVGFVSCDGTRITAFTLKSVFHAVDYSDFKPVQDHSVIEFQVPTAANNYTWYRKYADGWVEQGGKFSTPQSTNDTHANINITLPVTMANNLYDFYAGGMVIIENGGTGGGWAGFYKNTNSTATTLIILGWRTQTVSGNSFSWEVKGMAAQ